MAEPTSAETSMNHAPPVFRAEGGDTPTETSRNGKGAPGDNPEADSEFDTHRGGSNASLAFGSELHQGENDEEAVKSPSSAAVAAPTASGKSRPPALSDNLLHSSLANISIHSSPAHDHGMLPGASGHRGGATDVPSAVKLLVSAGLAGCLLGKGGGTINVLQEETGARIKLSQNQDYFPGTQDRVVLISGEAETCVTATLRVIKHLHASAEARSAAAAVRAVSLRAGEEGGVEDVSSKEAYREAGTRDGPGAGGSGRPVPAKEVPGASSPPSPSSPSPSLPTSADSFSDGDESNSHGPRSEAPGEGVGRASASVKLLIAKAAGGLVIGRAGSTIKALNEETGTRIQLAAKDEASGMVTGERVVTIAGPLPGVLRGVARLLEKLNEEPELARYQNMTTSYSRTGAAVHSMHPAFDLPTYQTQSFADTQMLFSPQGPASTRGHALNLSLSGSEGQRGHLSRSQGLGHSQARQSQLHSHGPAPIPLSAPLSASHPLSYMHPPPDRGPPHPPLPPFPPQHPSALHSARQAPPRHHGSGPPSGHSSPSLMPQHLLYTGHAPPSYQHMAPAFLAMQAAQDAATAVLTLQVPDKLIGSILGRSGVTLKKIQSDSGARISISKRGEFAPGTQNRVVTIDGPVQCTEVARGMVAMAVQQASMGPLQGSY
ncbi:neuro-oncological ventral antigen 2 [Nannochloropsis gaditana]|uniref:Neuro-oncological ventral antigen 2 n=1 Tax=Nannochloropsis gaditana TaxID=72520 RepID=W7TUC6_9STRA|nr:neuro-oncological ventral antigen 2 [Nannochloropsis gaditana]